VAIFVSLIKGPLPKTLTANGTVYFYQMTITISYYRKYTAKLECGPMPNVMAALPNIGGALCSTPQSLAAAHY